MNWADAIERWTEHMIAAGARTTTIVIRRYELARLASDHERRSPWQLTAQDLVSWLSGHDWAVETRRSYRAALRSFYTWAEDAGHVRRSPAARLPKIRPVRTTPRPAPEAVLEASLVAADDRVRLILGLAAYAGLRRAEIAALKWDHVSDTAIHVVAGKGGHDRMIPPHAMLRRLLTAELRRRDAGQAGTGWRYTRGLDVYVFPGMDGGPMTPDALGRIASRTLTAPWTLHTLRHRFATRVYEATRDILVVQELLGHASLVTSRRYTQTPDGAVLAAVEAI